MKRIVDWVDSRTGIRGLLRGVLYENIPGGARWRYVWGSTLIFAFAVQMITGLFLWMAYSPSSHTAWESVYYIQNVMDGGWLLRGIHHYTSQVMVVLLVIHVMQVLIDGAYRAPREFNFWIGLILLQIVLALGLTGYLLPWDQKGFWATKVATNIVGITPVVGHELQRVVVGGSEYGHHTLTRFFALHAGLLPALLVAFTGLHIYLFRKHGIHVKKTVKTADSYFWPDQVLKDSVACLAVLAVVIFLIFQHRIFGGADAALGATLMAPAEPSEPYAAARPDWYFLFLYQFLKLEYFKGENEVWGALYIPGIVMFSMLLMPFLGKWKLGHAFNVFLVCAILAGAGTLTAMALREDATDAGYQDALATAIRDAERVVVLAGAPTGIPPAGAVTLLREDPKTQGPRLFARYCASCHRHDGHDGAGGKPDDKPSASDLGKFPSVEWLEGLFDPEQIVQPHYFGATKFREGKMVEWVQDTEDFDDHQREMLSKVILALAAEARPPQQDGDEEAIRQGRRFITGKGDDGLNCVRCHTFRGEGKPRAPDLTGWGSREWLSGIVRNPGHRRFYGKRNDRMPAFGDKGILNHRQIGLIVDWLRDDWYEPGKVWPPVRNAPPATVESRHPEKETATVSPGQSEQEPEKPAQSAVAATTTPDKAVPVDFVRDIKPILEGRCLKCHGGGNKKPEGGYSLTTRQLALAPADSEEPSIIPGKRDESLLFERISSDDEDERMPPDGKAPSLTPDQIDAIGRWIDSGAAWPEGLQLEAVKSD